MVSNLSFPTALGHFESRAGRVCFAQFGRADRDFRVVGLFGLSELLSSFVALPSCLCQRLSQEKAKIATLTARNRR